MEILEDKQKALYSVTTWERLDPLDQTTIRELYDQSVAEGPLGPDALTATLAEISRLLGAGTLSSTAARQYARLFEEISSPERSLSNSYVLATRNLLFEWLPELACEHQEIPVVVLPGADWNAFAQRLPSGKAIVVLDFGATSLTRPVASLAWDFLATATDRPNPVRQAECAQGLVLAALYLRTQNPRIFMAAAALSRNAMDPAHWLNNSSGLMSMFVLLHEYGHVALRHFDQLTVGRQRVGGLTPYALQQGMEFEADRYALEQLVPVWSQRTSPGFIAVTIGITCRFFQLVDLLPQPRQARTHPLWLDRWKKIQQEHFVSVEAVDSVKLVDAAFDQLVSQLDVISASITVD